MNKKRFEISVGIFIVIGVLCLAFLTFKVSNSSLESFSSSKYTIQADFKNVGSLRLNAAVKIAGVEVGNVTKIALKKTYNGFMAIVTIAIISDHQIPSNYSASVDMSGILGDNYIALSPPTNDISAIAGLSDDKSNADQYMHQGSVIDLENTQSALDLGSLISTFVAGSDNSDNE